MAKYSKYFYLISAALLVTFAGNAFADSGFFNRIDTDKSIEYLNMLYGCWNPADTCGEGVLERVMRTFNFAILALGSMMVGYTIIMTTISTAQEGEIMGKKWSSVWIPLRAAIGTCMLVPAPNYSILQVIFIHIIMLGVDAANEIWKITVGAFSTTGIEGTLKVTIPDDAFKDVASHLFQGAVCADLWNNKYAGLLPSDVVPYYDTARHKLYWGIEGDSSYKNICGGVDVLANKPSIALDQASWQDNAASIIIDSAYALMSAASSAASDTAPDTYTIDLLQGVMNGMKNGIAGTPRRTGGGDTAIDPDQAEANGWLFAGSFYFAFIGSEGSDYKITNSPFKAIEPELQDLGDWGKNVYSPEAHQKAFDYLAHSESDSGDDGGGGGGSSGGGGDSPTTLEMSEPSGLSSEAQAFVKAITSPLRDLAYAFMEHLTARFDDPLASIREVGAEIMITCELIFFGIIAIVFIMLMAGCSMSGIQPTCWAIGAVVGIIVTILTLLIVLLWGIGAILAIYVPMVPYLVFTLTALGWFVLTIETLVAAPIVAFGIVSPAQEVLGKAQPAVLLITGVFLRPSLMVVGFVASIFLVRTIVEMINFGFAATVENSISGIGIFGVLGLIALYGGLILAIVQECFSLIYVIPDKVMRWIGGQVEHSQVGQDVKGLEKDVEKGAEMGGKLMKGGAAAAGSVAAALGGEKPGGGGSKKGKKGPKGDEGDEGSEGPSSGGGGDAAGGAAAGDEAAEAALLL